MPFIWIPLVPCKNIYQCAYIFIYLYLLLQEYYPNPNKFDPDRFDSEEKKKRNPMTWLPFGDGPRNCIGLRFGMMQTRIGLIALLNNFEFSLGPKMQNAPKFKPDAFTTVPQGGIHIKLKPIS